ncbi:MAG: hypothetical protein GWP16_00620 [Nitrospirae bacterium]|nr:hypothetical protein [Nitrospirota bacterium]
MKNKRNLTALSTLALMGALVFPGLVSAGHYYEAVTTSDTGQKKKKQDVMQVRAWVDDDAAKVEFVNGEKEGPFSAGSYLVTKDGGETVYLVNPKEETYGSFDMEAMMAAAGQAMNALSQTGGMVKMEFTDVSSEMLSEEAGGNVLGHDTTHYRWKSGYTMRMKMMGFKQETRVDMLQDVWSTHDLDARGFGVWMRPDRALKTGNEEFDKLISSQVATVRGFPLKTVNVSTTTNKKGKSMQTTSTTEVTTLREESIPGSTFGWPDHYTEVEILPQMPEGYGQQGEAQEDGSKKKGLKGLFKPGG